MTAASSVRKTNTEQRLTVLQLPEWQDANSYQSNLVEALKNNGVRAIFPSEIPRRRLWLHDFESIDIVHLHWPEAYSKAKSAIGGLLRIARFALYLRLIKSRGIGLVWTVHNLGAHDSTRPRLDRWMHKMVARNADRIIVHYPAAAKPLREWLRVTTSPVEVIDHPAFPVAGARSKTAARDSLGLEHEDAVLVYLGAIRMYKNVPRLLDAFRASAPTHAKLVIAGWVGDQALGREIHDLSSSDPRISAILEFVSDEQVDELMSAADVVAIPHTSGLTKGSAVLAMSYGKAIVGSDCGHLRYLLGSTQADLLFDPEDVEDMAQVISVALNDRTRLELLGEANRRSISDRTWAEAGRTLERIYHEIMQTSKS